MHLGAGGSSKNYRTWARVYCFCVSKRMQFHAVSLLTLFPLNKDNLYHRHSKLHDKARGQQGFKRIFSSVSLEYESGLCSGCARLCTFHKLHLRSGLPSSHPTFALLSEHLYSLQSDRSFMVWVMLLLLKNKKLKDLSR